MQWLSLDPEDAFVTGVFTGELFDTDGGLIAVESRRATVSVDLVEDDHGLRAQAHGLQLDFLGIPVDIDPFTIPSTLTRPRTNIVRPVTSLRRTGLSVALTPARLEPVP